MFDLYCSAPLRSATYCWERSPQRGTCPSTIKPHSSPRSSCRSQLFAGTLHKQKRSNQLLFVILKLFHCMRLYDRFATDSVFGEPQCVQSFDRAYITRSLDLISKNLGGEVDEGCAENLLEQMTLGDDTNKLDPPKIVEISNAFASLFDVVSFATTYKHRGVCRFLREVLMPHAIVSGNLNMPDGQ